MPSPDEIEQWIIDNPDDPSLTDKGRGFAQDNADRRTEPPGPLDSVEKPDEGMTDDPCAEHGCWSALPPGTWWGETRGAWSWVEHAGWLGVFTGAVTGSQEVGKVSIQVYKEEIDGGMYVSVNIRGGITSWPPSLAEWRPRAHLFVDGQDVGEIKLSPVDSDSCVAPQLYGTKVQRCWAGSKTCYGPLEASDWHVTVTMQGWESAPPPDATMVYHDISPEEGWSLP